MIEIIIYAKKMLFLLLSHLFDSISYLKQLLPYLYTFFFISSKVGATNSRQFLPIHYFLNNVDNPSPNKTETMILPDAV